MSDSEKDASGSAAGPVTSGYGEQAPTASWQGDHGTRRQRFRIVRPHAHGGLGQVSVAIDEELNREVALKEIREKYADDLNARKRFMLEAEITGALEHPGIVPVYSLGCDVQGRPFYATRFIRGGSLSESIAQMRRSKNRQTIPLAYSLEFRKLISRFIEVCNAVEYAHSRGVIHRDLKPANIMLGKYGETLVVDWGLAKLVGVSAKGDISHEPPIQDSHGSGESQTTMGSTVGTPEFMSPEQAEGRLDLLSPQSDVYCLGATLYSLLTGSPPFSGTDREEVLSRVRRGDFQRPRKVNPQIPAALEAVCLKAMSLQREDRYASPRLLADELERWMADEPVHARREPRSEAALRWMRRNRTWVAIATVALLTTSIAFGIGYVLVRQERNVARLERDRTEAQRQIAEQERNAARLAQQRADEESKNAKLASERALQNAASARNVIEQFLVRIGDDAWSQIPQFETVRLEMVRLAVDRYRELLKQYPNDVSLASDAAMALRRSANLYRMMNQLTRAKELYEEAIGHSERLLEGNASNVSVFQRHVELLNDAADLHRRLHGTIEAEPRFREVLDAAKRMCERFPESQAARKIEAQIKSSYGTVLHDIGRHESALSEAQESAATFSSFADANDRDIVSRRSAVLAWLNLSSIARDAGDLGTAEKASNEALQRSRANLTLSSRDPNLRYALGSALLERAAVMLTSRDTQSSARELLDESISMLESLVQENPKTASHRRKLAEATTRRGSVLLSLRDLSAAAKDAERAVELLNRLAAESTEAAAYDVYLGLALALQGKVVREQGMHVESLTILKRALDYLQRSLVTAPGNRFVVAEVNELKRLIDNS